MQNVEIDLSTAVSRMLTLEIETYAMVSIMFDEMGKTEDEKKALNQKFKAKLTDIKKLLGLDAPQV